jgi:hypothetical protein
MAVVDEGETLTLRICGLANYLASERTVSRENDARARDTQPGGDGMKALVYNGPRACRQSQAVVDRLT